MPGASGGRGGSVVRDGEGGDEVADGVEFGEDLLAGGEGEGFDVAGSTPKRKGRVGMMPALPWVARRRS
jgi:hypothetical protein